MNRFDHAVGQGLSVKTVENVVWCRLGLNLGLNLLGRLLLNLRRLLELALGLGGLLG